MHRPAQHVHPFDLFLPARCTPSRTHAGFCTSSAGDAIVEPTRCGQPCAQRRSTGTASHRNRLGSGSTSDSPEKRVFRRLSLNLPRARQAAAQTTSRVFTGVCLRLVFDPPSALPPPSRVQMHVPCDSLQSCDRSVAATDRPEVVARTRYVVCSKTAIITTTHTHWVSTSDAPNQSSWGRIMAGSAVAAVAR